jgi:hypothetical protein
MLHPLSSEELPRVTSFVPVRQKNVRTLAIVPAYDEGRCIGSVVLQAKAYVDEVLVVDDGSNDDTAQIAEAAGARVVRHRHNCGKGGALNTGLAHARELGATAVVLIDGDGQHRADEIPRVLDPILRGEADVVVGSRYLQPHDHVPRHRVLGHRALNWLTNAASGVYLSDTQNGFRALSSRALEAFRFSSQGFSVESEMQFLIHEHGLRCIETPVTTLYLDRPKRSAMAQGTQVCGGLLRHAVYVRPLQCLLLPGLAILMAGLGLEVPALTSVDPCLGSARTLLLLSAPMMILGTQVLFTGMIMYAIRSQLQTMLSTPQIEQGEEAEDGTAAQETARCHAAVEHHRRHP